MECLVVLYSLRFQREPFFVSAVSEDLEPEWGWPAPHGTRCTSIRGGGGVVASGSGQDGPVQLVGDPLVFMLMFYLSSTSDGLA